jgi:DNA mismatch repair protein MutS
MKKHVRILMTSFCACVAILIFGQKCQGEIHKEEDDAKTVLQKISDINMKTFSWKWEDWDTRTWREALEELQERTHNPKPKMKRILTFNLFEEVEKRQRFSTELTLNDEATWDDLNLFCGKTDSKKFIVNVLDRTQTEYGKVANFLLFAQPTTDITALKERQSVVQTFLENEELMLDCDKILSSLKESENVMLSFWNHGLQFGRTVREKNLYDNPFSECLNKSNTAVLLKSLHDHADRAWSVVNTTITASVLSLYGVLLATGVCNVPEFIIDQKKKRQGDGGIVFTMLSCMENRLAQVVVSLISGTFAAFNIKKYLEDCVCGFLSEKIIQSFMNKVSVSLKNMAELYHKISAHESLKKFKDFEALSKLFEEIIVNSEKLSELMTLINTDTLEEETSLISHKGIVIRSYVLMHDVKNLLEEALVAVGNIDAYISLAKLYKETQKSRNAFSFAQYKIAEKPFIKLSNFWHPLVGWEAVVPNSITVGSDGRRQNIIVTGPNEGGKSTSLKTIALCVLMAQTIGMVPAEEMIFTPFTSIATYFNITDDVGAGNSLFKAEVLRTEKLINRLDSLCLKEFSLTMFDEVFNGTSPREGEAAAYSVAQYLGQYPNNICFVATHFPLLADLEKTTNTFSNYKVSVIRSDEGTIRYPYRLEEGISHQYVAIDVLRNQGFSNNILERADEIIRKQIAPA